MNTVECSLAVATPAPVTVIPAGGVQVAVYGTAEEMGRASAVALAARQVELVRERGETSLQLMAAPSAFPFYEAYIRLAHLSPDLQKAIGKTDYFQFDDYPLPAHHQASFRFLLMKYLFGYLEDWYDPARINLFEPDIMGPEKACATYTEKLLAAGPDLMLKGQGEDGHWGFHQPGTPIDGEPAMIAIEMNEMNITQQMRDHPNIFHTRADVPQVAYTANVPLFMRTRERIEDNVPQGAKAYAVLAAYANDAIDACCPSSALKSHPQAVARTTTAAAWALVEYREKGTLDAAAMARLDDIWETPGDPQATQSKKEFMRQSLATLDIDFA